MVWKNSRRENSHGEIETQAANASRWMRATCLLEPKNIVRDQNWLESTESVRANGDVKPILELRALAPMKPMRVL